jgi:hypothetical protein
MARRFYPSRYESERRFPHKVDIRVPAAGLAQRVNEMERWCCENIRAGHWQRHVRPQARTSEGLVSDLRFYFLNEDDAQAFHKRWVEDGR